MATTTDDQQTAVDAPAVLTLTPEAHKIVAEALEAESQRGGAEEHPGGDTTAPAQGAADQGPLALWLEVRGVQAGTFVYDLYFQAVSDADEGDARHTQDGLDVIVPAASVERLRGARLEWSDEGEGGLVLVNPNAPTPEEASPGVPPEILAQGITGPLARRVVAVLEQSVNPAIAGHGGRADLVALDEENGTAYLRLSGGCQGCAMSQMTLRQGIETSLRDEVPELNRILDVTDHDSGENPFYS